MFCDTIDLDDHQDTQPQGHEAVATGLDHPVYVAIDADSVYWVDSRFDGTDGNVAKAPLSGGASTSLATTNVNAATGIELVDNHVYWSNVSNNNLMRVPKTGGSAEIFVLSGALVAIDSNSTAIFAPVLTAIAAYLSETARVVELATGLSQVVDVGAAANTVWAADIGPQVGIEYPNGNIIRVAADGSSDSQVVASNVNRPNRVVGNPVDVLWLDGGTSGAASTDGALWVLAPACGSDPVKLIDNLSTPWELAYHDGAVFFSSTDGDVWGLDLSSGQVTVYDADAGAFPGIAADDDHVYWTAPDSGEVRRAAR